MSKLDSLKRYINRRRRAVQVGYPLGPFQLGTTKELTSVSAPSFRLRGKEVPIRLPDDEPIRWAYKEIILEDEYGLLSFQRPVKTVLDIGGNVGLFCLAAREAFPDAVIHTYEPNPELEPYLKVQQAAANFTYYMEAVQKEDGFVNLALTGNSLETSSTVADEGNIRAVAFRTALARIGGSVDYLKMDCEGAEWDILKDTDSLKKVGYLALEYHCFEDGQTEEGILALVRACGFTIELHHPTPYYKRGIINAVRG